MFFPEKVCFEGQKQRFPKKRCMGVFCYGGKLDVCKIRTGWKNGIQQGAHMMQDKGNF